MKSNFIILILIGFACSSNVNSTKSNSFDIDQILPSGKKFYVKDSSQYSPEFIQGLRTIDSEYDSVRLIDANLILGNSEEYNLPIDLPLNKQLIYLSESDNNKYKLFLMRVNFTDIDYEFRLNDKSVKTGRVILSAGFIFGDETAEDVKSGEIYSLTQYFDKKGGWTCMKIENGSGNRVELSIEFDSSSTIHTIPTLRKK